MISPRESTVCIEPHCSDAETDDFLARTACPLVYYSPAYARFLARILPGATLHRLCARQAGSVVGVLPYAIQPHPTRGAVLNSLPFFGSHGGPWVDPTRPDVAALGSALLDALGARIEHDRVAAATVVENPLQPFDAAALARHRLVCVDDRVGQISPLPDGGDIETRLFAGFHEKTRNAVRKGRAQGQVVSRRDDDASLAWLQHVHAQSILGLGGVPKTLAVFQHLLAEFPLDSSSRLYIGVIDGRNVSGLLVLLYQGTAEYFTPVVDEEHRDRQVLSHLIFHAMTELAGEGYARWNWGGTWRSQEGVYRFKHRWGAVDHVYRYFNRCDDVGLRSAPRSELAAAFPWFYLFNYNLPANRP